MAKYIYNPQSPHLPTVYCKCCCVAYHLHHSSSFRVVKEALMVGKQLAPAAVWREGARMWLGQAPCLNGCTQLAWVSPSLAIS